MLTRVWPRSFRGEGRPTTIVTTAHLQRAASESALSQEEYPKWQRLKDRKIPTLSAEWLGDVGRLWWLVAKAAWAVWAITLHLLRL